MAEIYIFLKQSNLHLIYLYKTNTNIDTQTRTLTPTQALTQIYTPTLLDIISFKIPTHLTTSNQPP